MELPIAFDRKHVAAFCEKHQIVRLALFGSILTNRFTNDSDVDVLVEFHPDYVPGMLKLCRMEREFSEIIGRKVDMRTPGDLSRYFRDEVLKNALVRYAA